MMREKYESLPLATLKDLAKARGLKGISTMKKAELIERMLEEDEKEKKSARETVKELSANTGDKEVHDIDKLDSGITAHGILEVMQDGYGFIRSANYLPGENDVYVSPSQIRRFNLKTGDILVPQQILKDNYRQRCSQYFMKYFDKEYKKEQLAKDWKKYLTPDANNFNKFIVTNSGITFCFDEGTVLKKSEGIAYAGMASVMSKEILREHIIQRYIDPSKPMVALTFDDGPGGESEDRILTCLENNNSVATFFYQGMFIGGREEKIKRAKSIGCEIGHHTWNHPVLTSLNDDEVSAQITNTNNAIYNACGAYPTVFRPSYGMTNDKINQISGMPVIMWSIDTLDWKLRDGQKIYDKVVNSGNLDGKIVLMHSIHGFTADAVDSLVPWLKSRGYQLVTVSEMIKYKTGADPVPGAVYR